MLTVLRGEMKSKRLVEVKATSQSLTVSVKVVSVRVVEKWSKKTYLYLPGRGGLLSGILTRCSNEWARGRY